MEDVLDLARQYQRRAWEVIARTDVVNIWKSVGAEPNLVGSLRTGLLMKHRDIDFHIYSDPFWLEDSFRAASLLGQRPGIRRIEYINGLDTDEKCVEWHAWYEDDEGEIWQIDMIHMPKESPYAGWFEQVADRISDALTPETRLAVLRVKLDVPDGAKVPGVEIYRAVLDGGVTDYAGFLAWKQEHREDAGLRWLPQVK